MFARKLCSFEPTDIHSDLLLKCDVADSYPFDMISRTECYILAKFSNDDNHGNENNRSAHKFYVFVHFFAVISKTTT